MNLKKKCKLLKYYYDFIINLEKINLDYKYL